MPDAGDVTAKFLGDPSGFLDAVAQVKDALAGLSGGGVDLGDTFAKGNTEAANLASTMKEVVTQVTNVGNALSGAGGGGTLISPETVAAIGRFNQAFKELGTSIQANVPQIEQGGAALSGMVTTIAEEVLPRLPELASSLHDTMGQVSQSLQIPGVVESNIVDQWNRVISPMQDQATIQLPQFAESLQSATDVLANAAPTWREQFGLGSDVQLQFDKNGTVIGEGARLISESLNQASNSAGDFKANISGANDAFSAFSGGMMRENNIAAFMNPAYADAFGNAWEKAGGAIKASTQSIGLGEGIGGAFASLGQGIDNFIRPLFYLQMGAQLVGSLASGIYNAAVIAEGPAAHSMGSFTGTVDALGVAFQKSSAIFSESFGQGIMPTLNALNNQLGGGGGTGGIGGFLGGITSMITNLAMLGTGLAPITGFKGEVNQVAGFFGLQQPFTGGGADIQAQLAISIAAIPAQIALQTAQMHAEATNPAFLQAQAQLTAAQTIATTAAESTVTFREALIAAANPSSQQVHFTPPTFMGQFAPPQYYQPPPPPPPPQIYPGMTGGQGFSMPSIGSLDFSGLHSQILSSILTGLSTLGNITGIAVSPFNFAGLEGQIGAAISSGLSSIGKVTGISIPSIDFSGIGSSIMAALNAAISNLARMVSGGATIPSFASGVSNFGGGLAYVHSDELIYMPPGSSVTPSSGSSGSSSITPISMSGGGGGPQTITMQVNLDSQAILTAQGIPLASTIRLYNGSRSG